MNKWPVRIMLLVLLPFILALKFLIELVREIASAFRYAWFEVLIEMDSFKTIWRNCDGTEAGKEAIKNMRGGNA